MQPSVCATWFCRWYEAGGKLGHFRPAPSIVGRLGETLGLPQVVLFGFEGLAGGKPSLLRLGEGLV